MKIVVTGATGFVGRHLVGALLRRGHAVTAVARRPPMAAELSWTREVNFTPFDVEDNALDPLTVLDVPDVLVYLAWAGLPNYKEPFHFETNLPAAYRFIKRMVTGGTRQVLVTGTCFEYGMQNGPLSEEVMAFPSNAYGLAKNTLRLFLEALEMKHSFVLQWVRLFYLYGAGQNSGSLLAQLHQAIDRGDTQFNMSGGEQLRDYLSVAKAAEYLTALIEHPSCSGVINCCSGQAISIRRLVEQTIRERDAEIALNLGHFPYPDYEPFAFWGSRKRLDELVGERS